MGQTKSSLSKKDRKTLDSLKKEKVESRVQEIERAQKVLLAQNQSQLISTQEAVDILEISNQVKRQVQRGNKPLTKADLIAIVIRLKGGSVPELQVLSIPDLNALIRDIIYEVPGDVETLKPNRIDFPALTAPTSKNASKGPTLLYL